MYKKFVSICGVRLRFCILFYTQKNNNKNNKNYYRATRRVKNNQRSFSFLL